MTHFTPLPALAGGLMIGCAAVLYLVLTGRYAGISGIIRGAVFGDPARSVDVLFAAGLLIGGAVVRWVSPPAIVQPAAGLGVVALGGLLVGVGTSLGGGCTSGHGVCGLGRFSPRSLVAVVTFVAAGMVTVFLKNHLPWHGA